MSCVSEGVGDVLKGGMGDRERREGKRNNSLSVIRKAFDKRRMKDSARSSRSKRREVDRWKNSNKGAQSSFQLARLASSR